MNKNTQAAKPLSAAQKKTLSEVKKVGEINFHRLPNGQIAVPMILSPDIELGSIINALDQILTPMIEAYKILGDKATGAQYVQHQNQSSVGSNQ